MVIAGMVSNGLSNLSPLAALQGKRPVARECVPAWYDPFMPQHSSTSLGSFGKGGTFWNMSGIDKSNTTKYKMEAFVTGYAFSSNGPTAIVAIVILLIYCVVAISHTLHVCFTCRSSSSWDSIPEIVALAIQSPPTKVLKNTGAGISTKNIFKHDVQIRDVDGRVQLMFDDTKIGSLSVEENKEYG
ncbi:hypothetical protein N7488_008595 [Penicillium malachiteum]|nr:hypothetical protein N7488_008595 [Penicillium malachiteum]